MIDPRVRGRVAVVTGVDDALGVGAAVARGLARVGARLVLARSPGASDHVVEVLRAEGAVVASVAVDVTESGAAQRVFDVAERQVGPVRMVVHCSGADSLVLSERGVDAHHGVWLRAPGLLLGEFERRFAAQGAEGGRVVLVAPVRARGGECAGVGVLESLTRWAAGEFAGAGITVNLVVPGVVQTGWVSRDERRRLAEHSPLGRVGHPEDVADLVVFLLSHQARWLTGQTLRAGGG